MFFVLSLPFLLPSFFILFSSFLFYHSFFFTSFFFINIPFILFPFFGLFSSNPELLIHLIIYLLIFHSFLKQITFSFILASTLPTSFLNSPIALHLSRLHPPSKSLHFAIRHFASRVKSDPRFFWVSRSVFVRVILRRSIKFGKWSSLFDLIPTIRGLDDCLLSSSVQTWMRVGLDFDNKPCPNALDLKISFSLLKFCPFMVIHFPFLSKFSIFATSIFFLFIPTSLPFWQNFSNPFF